MRKVIAVLDFTAYLAAQHLTQIAVHHAQPLSQAQAVAASGDLDISLVAARQWTSAILRRLADFAAVAPDVRVPSQPIAHHA